jgi:cytidylate kinase
LPLVAFGVVCISSEDGAAAEEASQLIAGTLGFRLINEDIVARAAVEAGVNPAVVADVEQRRSVLTRLLESMGPAAMASAGIAMLPEDFGYERPAEGELRMLIRSAIEEFATAGEAVIVAHAASLALAEREDVLRVLITASQKTRESRIATSLEISESEAARLLKRSDAGRADYVKRFYGIGAELPTHYDLVINTDRLTADDAARLIVRAANGAA